MADQPDSGGKKSSFGFLTRKLGPLPVWAWAGIAFGGYYWYTHFGPGARKQQAAQKQQQQRPQVIIINDHHNRRPPPRPRPRIFEPQQQQPVQASAPMTAEAVYGTDVPVADMTGSTYDPTKSEIPADSGPVIGGAYVPAA